MDADNVLLFESSASGLGGPDDFLVRELRGVEQISRPYELEIVVECTIDGGLSAAVIDSMLSNPAWIGMGPSGARKIHGVLSEVELLDMDPSGGWSCYRVVLVPSFWLTTLT